MALAPEAEAQIKRNAQEQQERFAGTRPMYDTAFTIKDHRLVTPGCEAWSNPERKANLAADEPEPTGGVILEITTAPSVDTETGEVTDRRAYRCYDYSPGLPPHRRIVLLTEDQVAGFDRMDIALVRSLARQLARSVKTRGIMTADEIGRIQDAARLAAIAGIMT